MVNDKFTALVNNPLKMRLFMLRQLPVAFFSGLKVLSFDGKACSVQVPYRWITKNPFRSTYFASLAMAAEMSTGLLAMGHLHNEQARVSMLVTGMNARYFKKATSVSIFTCRDGEAMSKAIREAVTTGNGVSFRASSTGTNKNAEPVADFIFEWSFKLKNN